jgi:hypothetical protein
MPINEKPALKIIGVCGDTICVTSHHITSLENTMYILTTFTHYGLSINIDLEILNYYKRGKQSRQIQPKNSQVSFYIETYVSLETAKYIKSCKTTYVSKKENTCIWQNIFEDYTCLFMKALGLVSMNFSTPGWKTL